MRAPHARCRALALMATLLAVAPGAALAADGLREESHTTYTVRPDEGSVRVESAVTLKHDGPRGSAAIRTWTPLRLPSEAVDVQTGRAILLGDAAEADGLAITRPVTLRKPMKPGQQRSFKVDYDLVSIPGLETTTRIEPDYARLCWTGLPTRKGSVKARFPAGWEVETTPGATALIDDGGRPTETMISGTSPADLAVCSDAFHPDSVDRVYILGPDEEVVTIDGWGSHPGWKDAVSQAVAVDLRNLRRLIGVPLAVSELRIQEVARPMPTYVMGDYRADEALLYLDEDIDRAGVATVAFARLWFNGATVAEPWLEQGLARWSGLSAIGEACPDAGAAPVDPAPSLAAWPDPSASLFLVDRRLLRWRSDVACGAVAAVADAIGPEGMTGVVTELLSADEPVGWRDWLDLAEVRLEKLEVVDRSLARDLLIELGLVTAEDLADFDASGSS